MVFEADDLSGFKIHLFIGQMFVVPSSNVMTKTNLGFIPFLFYVATYFLRSTKTRSVHC